MHLSEWTLEQMAEASLPAEEERAARQHLASCGRCAAELEGYRALFAALEGLPRFAPSPGFSDAVIARTRLTPEPGPLALWLRRFAPKSRRGWVLLGAAVAAPAAPVLAAALWLLTHPLLTPAGLVEWVWGESRSVGAQGAEVLLRWAADSGLAGVARGVYEVARAVPAGAVTVLAVLLAIAFPLSVWAIYRLVRPPMKDVTYAAN